MSDEKLQRAEAIRSALPEGGLFHEKSWRVSPDAFVIDRKFSEEIDKLGYRLTRLVRACNQLYRFSISGRQPEWIADLLDRGKPPELVALQREKALVMAIPRVIRPDLILTDDGYIIAELDNVPGGIGLTAWLDQVYSQNGAQILGGTEGMLDGFASILPGRHCRLRGGGYLSTGDGMACGATQRIALGNWALARRRCASTRGLAASSVPFF
jgi:hypothetical protein